MMTSGFVDHVRGEVITSVEKEKTDRLRERRKKKLLQGKRRKERELAEKAVDKANPGLGNKHAKLQTLRQLQRAEKEGTVTMVIYLNLFLSFPFFSLGFLGSFLCQRPLLILGYGRSGRLAFRSAVNVTDLTKVAFFFFFAFLVSRARASFGHGQIKDNKNPSLKSSTAFFNRLQEEVSTQVGAVKDKSKKPIDKLKRLTGTKLKL